VTITKLKNTVATLERVSGKLQVHQFDVMNIELNGVHLHRLQLTNYFTDLVVVE